jgi:hypothetical protein
MLHPAKYLKGGCFTGQTGPANNATYINRLNAITQIKQIDLHVEEVTGADKDVDVVVDIFNRGNIGGTKLSKGHLALAKVCADWPEPRDRMKDQLLQWEDAAFSFDLDWLLRNVNTVLTGEARFRALHNVRRSQFEDGLKRSIKACNFLLNLVSNVDRDLITTASFSVDMLSL